MVKTNVGNMMKSNRCNVLINVYRRVVLHSMLQVRVMPRPWQMKSRSLVSPSE